ncbi:YbhB/YbcL family Raf kinase inhibitor-like protein [Cupriavidus numazuensis]|uniref:YbhB/YbcL family Raf kinase inhibitor-like protein n=1 Tax=Cupriavidus numazuensis TaxID=221992 RepID=A0ABN7PYB4_9BURK|nr:YbhB/YbcL family Raf kinase inhibitor-like protein [Cupriavidus numazuensis]CAG2147332.1 hypothetical protein LMG26411_03126 [Cupriavidus numazuensis]
MSPWVQRCAGLLLRGRHAGEHTLTCRHASLARVPVTVRVEGAMLRDGGVMTQRWAGAGVGTNRSPALSWHGMPTGATHWLLLVEDPDVPLKQPIVHAVAWGSVRISELAEGSLAVGAVPEGAVLGINGLGNAGYDGPRPLPGHGPHRYVFQLYALDAEPSPQLRGDILVQWLATHAMAMGQLTGICQRDWRGRLVAADPR